MDKQYKRGLVPLSADPITFGHIDLIERAARKCSDVIVLIGDNDMKRGKYLFSLDERIDLARQSLSHVQNIRVQACRSLLVDVCLQEGVEVVFRGIRNNTDRQYESMGMHYHNCILPGFLKKVVYLNANPDLVGVSSTIVKIFASHHVDIQAYVPLCVKAALEQKMHNQYLIGVTGGIATGKSYVASRLAQRLGGTHINFDQLIRSVYEEDSAGAQLLRDKLAEHLGPSVLSNEGKAINSQILKERMFACDDVRGHVETLTAPHVMRLYREQLSNIQGIVIVEWAQMVEMGLTHLVNNRVIVVDSPNWHEMLGRRGISKKIFDQMKKLQLDSYQKLAEIQSIIAQERFGQCIEFQNDLDSEEFAKNMDTLVETIKIESLQLSEER